MMRRAYTLIETCLAVLLTGILVSATLMLFLSAHSLFQFLSLQAQLRGDTKLVAQRLFHLAGPGARITPDQSGLVLRGGGEVRFRDHNLWYGGRPLLGFPLEDFMVVRREGRLLLTFVVRAPQRRKGAWTTHRFRYEQTLEGR